MRLDWITARRRKSEDEGSDRSLASAYFSSAVRSQDRFSQSDDIESL